MQWSITEKQSLISNVIKRYPANRNKTDAIKWK